MMIIIYMNYLNIISKKDKKNFDWDFCVFMFFNINLRKNYLIKYK